MNADEARELYAQVGINAQRLREEEKAKHDEEQCALIMQTSFETIKGCAIDGQELTTLRVDPPCHTTIQRNLEELGFRVTIPSPILPYMFVSWKAPSKEMPVLPPSNNMLIPRPENASRPTPLECYMYGVVHGVALGVVAMYLHPFG